MIKENSRKCIKVTGQFKDNLRKAAFCVWSVLHEFVNITCPE